MNQVALTRFGGLDGAKKFAGALMNIGLMVGSDDGKPILKMSKDGYWTFGQEEIELEEGDLLAINPASIKHGYIAFADDGPATTVDGDQASIYQPITMPLPYVNELPEVEEVKGKRGKQNWTPHWQFTLAFDAVVIEGPNTGAEMVYKPVSKGGLRMIRMIAEEIAKRLEDGSDECVPVVELFSDHYDHKTYGKTYFPVCEILEMMTLDDQTFSGSGTTDHATKPVKHPKKGETTARGHKVDARAEEPAAEEAPRVGRTRGREEAEVEVPGRVRGTRRSRDAVDAEPVEEPKGERGARRTRGRDDDARPAPERTREPRTRGRDREEAEPATEEAPRVGRRGGDAEPARETGVRGRNAVSGRRSRGERS